MTICNFFYKSDYFDSDKICIIWCLRFSLKYFYLPLTNIKISRSYTMFIICTMVSRWCRCEGHLLSGVEATCTVSRGCWPPTTHSIMLPPTPPWTLYKTFFWGDWLTFVSSQQLKILKTIRYLLIVRKLASGQFPSINLKLIEIFNELEKLEAAKAAWLVCFNLLSLTASFLVLLVPSGLIFFWPYWALLSLTGPYLALLGLT